MDFGIVDIGGPVMIVVHFRHSGTSDIIDTANWTRSRRLRGLNTCRAQENEWSADFLFFTLSIPQMLLLSLLTEGSTICVNYIR